MAKKSVKKVTTRARVSLPVLKKIEVKKISEYYTPIMVVLLIVASFYIGRLSSKLDSVKGAPAAGTAPTQQAAAPSRALDVPALKERAKRLGLDTNKFNTCLDSGAMAPRVGAEQSEGSSLGVSGTPTFFINGVMLVGAQPQSSFESVIEAELKNGTGDKVAATLGEDGKRVKLSLTSGYVSGASNAKIKMVEFTDFECPYCERAFPTIEAIMKKYEGKISLEYKSFPLSFHPLAQKAAEAALCAGDQGKFWEMHDDLFASAK